jgi:hypothetical protein
LPKAKKVEPDIIIPKKLCYAFRAFLFYLQ